MMPEHHVSHQDRIRTHRLGLLLPTSGRARFVDRALQDGVATEINPNFDAAKIHPAGAPSAPTRRRGRRIGGDARQNGQVRRSTTIPAGQGAGRLILLIIDLAQ
jgi:hypothetical protein